jgi:hypothetical protein
MNPIVLIAEGTSAVLAAADEFPDLSAGQCRGMPPEWFYPEQGQNMARIRVICDGCPVKALCREWGIHHEHHGVWGGLTERGRRIERRRRAIVATDPASDQWFNPVTGFSTERSVA